MLNVPDGIDLFLSADRLNSDFCLNAEERICYNAYTCQERILKIKSHAIDLITAVENKTAYFEKYTSIIDCERHDIHAIEPKELYIQMKMLHESAEKYIAGLEGCEASHVKEAVAKEKECIAQLRSVSAKMKQIYQSIIIPETALLMLMNLNSTLKDFNP
jgi:hypothetical protein